MERAGAREDVTLLGKNYDEVAAETVEGGGGKEEEEEGEGKEEEEEEEKEEGADASLKSTSTHFAFRGNL
jgi:hypothetical protein